MNRDYHHWVKASLAILDAHCVIRGAYPESNPAASRPTFIMSNHTSFLDTLPCIAALKGGVRFLLKVELLKLPVLGFMFKHIGCVAIDRKKPKEAMTHLRQQLARSQSLPIWCSPEGTRSPNGQLQPFKRGIFKIAIEQQAIVIPITVVGMEKIMAKKSLRIHRGQPVTLSFGEALDTSNPAYNTIDGLMQAVRLQMASQIEVAARSAHHANTAKVAPQTDTA